VAPLTDGVVTLREWSEGDVPALVAAAHDHELHRLTRFPSPYSERDAHDFIAGRVVPETGFAIVAVQDDRLLGGIGVRDAGEGRAQLATGWRRPNGAGGSPPGLCDCCVVGPWTSWA